VSDFYLPYHFVPVAKGRKGDLAVSELKAGNAGNVRHDRYETGTYSGTIECVVEAASPVFIGDEKVKGEEVVPGYKLNGAPALPASSLRGLVASMAEAASNSALRVLSRTVLGEPCYSFRKMMRQPLTAVGMLWKNGAEWELEPVCLPLLQYSESGALRPDMQKWKKVFSRPVLRVFLGDEKSIRQDVDDPPKKRWGLRTGPMKFPVKRLSWADMENLNGAPAKTHLHAKKQTVVSQKPSPGAEQVGLARVLGCYEKDASGEPIRQIADSKKHELFLPYEKGAFPRLKVMPIAMERFEQLANQMAEDSKRDQSARPYEPKDTRPGRKPGDKLVPKEGDLVFFDFDEKSKQVTDFAYSSIWRGRVEANGKAANAWSFFAGVDAQLTPFHGERRQITLAERVFGFVEEKDGEEAPDGLRLKGRVRFSPGLAVGRIEEMKAVPLKELSSPKPPSPSLYFRKQGSENGYIAKSELKPAVHIPQGRKMYLHHLNAVNGNGEPWRNAEQNFVSDRHVRVRPWAKGAKWRFEVRFDNLNDLELGMVLYALSPGAGFLHKIGMGKPLGLGSIRIGVERVKTIDRAARYTAKGWGSARFAGDLDWEKTRDEFRAGLAAEIRAAIQELGDVTKLDGKVPITYPRVEGQQGEEELYQWFVSNDQAEEGERVALQPVTVMVNGRAETRIQPLPRLRPPKKK